MKAGERVAELTRRIENARQNAPLASQSVTLLAASKAQPEVLIEEAVAAGISVYGENRVQEAQAKWPAIKKRHPHIRLHLIGPLQTNKVKEALSLFDVIETIDRLKLADEIAKARDAGFGIQEKRFFIQVNTGAEPQKAGISVEEADALIGYCLRELRLPVTGLMCVPPVGQPAAPHFALLRQTAQRHGLKELSMGMSDDFETAVRMGATIVRIGTALFGKRDRPEM
jgi:PLP dependent protein